MAVPLILQFFIGAMITAVFNVRRPASVLAIFDSQNISSALQLSLSLSRANVSCEKLDMRYLTDRSPPSLSCHRTGLFEHRPLLFGCWRSCGIRGNYQSPKSWLVFHSFCSSLLYSIYNSACKIVHQNRLQISTYHWPRHVPSFDSQHSHV